MTSSLMDYDLRQTEEKIVCSKSEIIIANMLNKKADNLSYRYEAELYLKKANRIVHPDFTILNKKSGKIYY